MTTLQANKRDSKVKAKALRRQGKVIGSISGKGLPETISIVIDSIEAGRFLRDHKKGSQVILDVDGEKIDSLVKSTTFDAASHQYIDVEFQALVAGEKVHSTAKIVFKNEEKAAGLLTHELTEVAYKAIPSALVETIEIDVATLPLGTKILVKDLDIAKNNDVELITPLDAPIIHIAAHHAAVEEESTDTEAAAPATEA